MDIDGRGIAPTDEAQAIIVPLVAAHKLRRVMKAGGRRAIANTHDTFAAGADVDAYMIKRVVIKVCK